jgi:hypothetical protein
MTKAELEDKIRKSEKLADNKNMPEAMRNGARANVEKFKKELEELEKSKSTPAPAPAPAKATKSKTTASASTGNPIVDVALGKIKSIAGTPQAIDEATIKRLIQEQMKDADGKISLADLSDDLKKYIDKYKMIEISIPRYGFEVKMNSEVAQIENIFKILDDILVGNNVYLIGEAGTGKTYTAEMVAQVLQRQKIILNCSQYTSPTEILGGQTIEGYVDGKLIIAWRDGGILILDEMPKLDPNTAGLFNDALAKSSKTRKDDEVSINSANPKAPAIKRNANFGVIATGNIYPNAVDMQRYVGNNQQDLSLLDRFSGSVYFVGYSVVNDKTQARYQFLYDLLVGEETDNKKWGFRFFMIDRGYTRYSVLSLRTIIAMRVAFEIEVSRAFAKKAGKEVSKGGKTLWDAIESFLVAFPAEAKEQMIQRFDLREDAINAKVRLVLDKIVNGGMTGLKSVLTENVRENATGINSELSAMNVSTPLILKSS